MLYLFVFYRSPTSEAPSVVFASFDSLLVLMVCTALLVSLYCHSVTLNRMCSLQKLNNVKFKIQDKEGNPISIECQWSSSKSDLTRVGKQKR